MSIKKIKKSLKILLVSITLLVGVIYFSLNFFFGKINSTYAAYNKKDPIKLLVSPLGNPRYLFVPSAPLFFKNLNENKKLNQFMTSVVGKDIFQNPPLKALGIMSELFSYLPLKIRRRALLSLFSGSVYYVSSLDGFVLIFETNRVGRYALKKLKGKGRHISMKGNFFILASSSYYLQKQLARLEKNISGYSSAKYKNSSLYMITPFNSLTANKKSLDKDLYFGIYGAIFKADVFNYQSIKVTPSSSGILLEANARFNKALGVKVKKLHDHFYDSKEKDLLNEYTPSDEIIVNFHSDIAYMENFMNGSYENFQKTKNKSSTIYQFTGFMEDYGLLVPNIAIAFSHSNSYYVKNFLQNAFKFKKIKESAFGKNGNKIQRIRYSYYRGNQYYGFSPVYSSINESSMIWASSEQNYKQLSNILLKKTNRRRNLSFVKFSNNHPIKPNESLFFTLSGDLKGILKSSLKKIKNFSGRYSIEAFADLKDTLPKIITHFTSNKVHGKSYISSEKLRSIIKIEI